MQKLPSYVVKNISPPDLAPWCFKGTKTSQSSAINSTENAVLRSMSLLAIKVSPSSFATVVSKYSEINSQR